MERDRVGFEEEVDHAVNEGHVEGYEDKDRFHGEHDEGAVEVAVDDFVDVNLAFVGWGVDGPVLGFEAEFGGFLFEEYGCVGFGTDEECEGAEEGGRDQGQPCSPSPAQITLSDKAAHNRTCHRSNKCSAGEETKRKSSFHRTPEISQGAADDG